MDNTELIELFYNRTYEKSVNKQILDDKNYILPRNQLLKYIHDLTNIPYVNFIEYIKAERIERKIEVSDITHYISFSSCEIEMCNALTWANNPGCKIEDIKNFFPYKKISKKESASRLWGEQHIKASSHLGLSFKYYNYWYLSCIGYVYPDLDKETRKKLLARTITRSPLYCQMLCDITSHDIDPLSYMNIVLKNVGSRRMISVCSFLSICLDECTNQGIYTYKVIDVKDYLKGIRKFSNYILTEKNISTNKLPCSEGLSTANISFNFLHAVNTYNFFWFLSLLHIFKTEHKATISTLEIKKRMIAFAWYILSRYKVSFGPEDSITYLVNTIQLHIKLTEDLSLEQVIEVYSSKQWELYLYKKLYYSLDDIPINFLKPWIPSKSNSSIAVLSRKNHNGCLYSLNCAYYAGDAYKYITINPEWSNYLEDNYDTLFSYTLRELSFFIEKHNLTEDNFFNKLSILFSLSQDNIFLHQLHSEDNNKSTSQPSSSMINYDDISFTIDDGSPLSKEKLVLEVIKQYVKRNKNIKWDMLIQLFPNTLKKNSEFGTIELLSTVNIKGLCDPTIKSYFFMDKNDIISLKGGTKCVVNRVWDKDFGEFLKIAARLFEIKEIYKKSRK